MRVKRAPADDAQQVEEVGTASVLDREQATAWAKTVRDVLTDVVRLGHQDECRLREHDVESARQVRRLPGVGREVDAIADAMPRSTPAGLYQTVRIDVERRHVCALQSEERRHAAVPRADLKDSFARQRTKPGDAGTDLLSPRRPAPVDEG